MVMMTSCCSGAYVRGAGLTFHRGCFAHFHSAEASFIIGPFLVVGRCPQAQH